MKGILRGICRAVPFLLLAAVVLAVSLFPRQSAAEGESVRIVRVWNVDTFEGGKGSRTAFLKRAAELAERGRTGVRYLVTSVTAEGALDALGFGKTDMSLPKYRQYFENRLGVRLNSLKELNSL